ncbi:UPF0236 family transposase-like protein [Spiroplasma endosymbiont of Dactylopius coccus]
MIQQHKNPQHFKLLNSYQISRTSVYQKIVLKSVAIPVNHKLVNKRVDVIIRPTKTAIGVKKTAEFIKEQGNRFFENFDQAKIIICGDSAGWIKEVADYLGANFVLDKFHLV